MPFGVVRAASARGSADTQKQLELRPRTSAALTHYEAKTATAANLHPAELADPVDYAHMPPLEDIHVMPESRALFYTACGFAHTKTTRCSLSTISDKAV